MAHCPAQARLWPDKNGRDVSRLRRCATKIDPLGSSNPKFLCPPDKYKAILEKIYETHVSLATSWGNAALNSESTQNANADSNWQDEQKKLWGERARDYSKLDWVNKQDFMGSLVEFCAPQPDWNAVDIGTGPGVVAAALAPFVREVTGVDIIQEMIDSASRTHAAIPNASFRIEDAETLETFKDNSLDLATARMVFHHVHDCPLVLSQIQRILRPGGECVVCEGVPPDHLTRQRYIDIFELKEKRHTFSEAELINMFDRAGYEDIIVKPFFMRQVSLNNWLANGMVSDENIAEITRLHLEADDHFKNIYRLTERDGDVFMDWKFIFIKGRKPGGET